MDKEKNIFHEMFDAEIINQVSSSTTMNQDDDDDVIATTSQNVMLLGAGFSMDCEE